MSWSRSGKPDGTPCISPSRPWISSISSIVRLIRLGDGLVVLGLARAVDVEHLGLRAVDDLRDIALTGLAELGDALADLDESAQHGLLADDVGVEVDVGGDRHAGDEGVEIGRATDAADISTTLQLGGDRDRVGGLAAVGQVDDRVEDQLVGGPVEVAALEDVGGRVDGLLADQHGSEHALLGGQILWRNASGAGVLAGPGRSLVEVRHTH